MDNYDVVIEKTVRDLFRSTKLSQIRKYKLNKEKEINNKNDDLKNLILEKYPLLIEGIDFLEKISNNLIDLKEMRQRLEENLKNVGDIERDGYLNVDELYIHLETSDVSITDGDQLEREIDSCWTLMKQLEIDKLIDKLSNLRPLVVKSNLFLQDNYDFIVVDLLDYLMKRFVSEENPDEERLRFYFTHFIYIHKLFLCMNDKLMHSEFYLKLNTDEVVQKFYSTFFSFLGDNEISFSLELSTKLIILRISRCFKNLIDCPDGDFISNGNIKNMTELVRNFLLVNSLIEGISKYPEKLVNDDPHKLNISTQAIEDTRIRCKDVQEKIKDFTNFFIDEINNHITNLINVEVVQEKMNVINFWNEILSQLNKYKVSMDTIQVADMLLPKAKEQTINFAKNLCKQYAVTHYNRTKANLHLYLVLSELKGVDKSSYFTMAREVFLEALTELLETADRNKTNFDYIKFIVKSFSYKTFRQTLSELHYDHPVELLNGITKIYLNNKYSQFEEYLITFRKYISIEYFQATDEDERPKCSDSLTEMTHYILTNFSSDDYELDDQSVNDPSFRIKLLHTVTSNYIDELNKILRETNLYLQNRAFYSDLRILLELNKDDEVKSSLEELLDLLFRNFDGVAFTPNDSLIKFVNGENLSCALKIEGEGENRLLTRDLSSHQNGKKRSILTYAPRLSAYMINKNQDAKSKVKQSNQVSGSFKLLDHRIDESYLSLKPGPNNQGTYKDTTLQYNQGIQAAKGYMGYFSGKIKEGLSYVGTTLNTANQNNSNI